MTDYESCISKEIEKYLSEEEKMTVERIIENAKESANQQLNCVIRNIENSKSLPELAYNMEAFSSSLNLTIYSLADRLLRHIPTLADSLLRYIPSISSRPEWARPRIYNEFFLLNEVATYIFEKTKGTFLNIINQTIDKAKVLASKLGAESLTISMSMGLPFSFQISYTINLNK